MRRQDLPIDEVIPEIIGSLEKTHAVVIEATPGAGKTTRVPVAIDRTGVADEMVPGLHIYTFSIDHPPKV